MPAPEALRLFTVHILNPILRPFAGHLPGFATVVYVGRTSGKTYRTPVNVFVRDGEFVFALSYGSKVNWVQNVMAASGCNLEYRGKKFRLTDPRVIVDPTLHLLPIPARWIELSQGVTEFLILRPADEGTGAAPSG
jgi:deazaflavin-dependent oxidoreductase (nitroreductase family)